MDVFNFWSARSPIPLSYHQPALTGFTSMQQIRQDREPVKGIILLGSAASANDPDPWVATLMDWLKLHIDAATPILGICFGHQLIGKMFGAPVGYMFPNQLKLKGLRTVRLQNTRHYNSLPSSGQLVISHAEAVFDVPKEMEILATSPEVAVDGLVHQSKPIWTFQSHPEATGGFLDNQGIDVDTTLPHLGYGHCIVGQFLDFCAQRNLSN